MVTFLLRNRRELSECVWLNTFLNDVKCVPGSIWYDDFRKMFRIPKSMFDEILQQTRDSGLFPDERRKSDRGKPPAIPLGLKVLACLRVLALGTPFDALSIESCCSGSCLQNFFHKWMRWYKVTYYDITVHPPRNEEEVKNAESLYRLCGFPACLSSMDGVHVAWDMCPAMEKHLHKGKEDYPTLVVNVHVGNNKFIYSVTKMFPGAMNDKSIVRFDQFCEVCHSFIRSFIY